uniref:Putative capsid protein n=1 Tax=viral metagenome TaxID=1070528 RepID=A0A6H2A1Q2_9ZZZZ
MAEITEAFVKQFKGNMELLSQQKGSRLLPCVRLETGSFGEEEYFDQYGSDLAKVKVVRNSDVEYAANDYERRRVSFIDVYWAKLVDKEDKLRMLIDPTSTLAQAGAYAIGRKIDDMIIDAYFGTAKTGHAGGTDTTFTAAHQIAAGATGLTLAKLLAGKEILDGHDVDPSEERYVIVTAKQMTNLLNTTEIKNTDYNSVKALVEGQINTFLGFNFIRTERLTVDATPSRRCMMFSKEGILLARQQEMGAKMDVIPTKHYATQVYASVACGSTRMDETRCVEIKCTEV